MTDYIYEAVRYAHAEGRLTGDNLHLDGEPLGEQAAGEYDAAGWSVATSHGCRRHQAVDERLAELASGDEVQRHVAETFPRWFGFGNPTNPFTAAGDVPPNEADELQVAVSRWVVLVGWMGGNAVRLMPFVTGYGATDPRIPHHTVLLIGSARPGEQIAAIEEATPKALLDRIDTLLHAGYTALEQGRPLPGPH